MVERRVPIGKCAQEMSEMVEPSPMRIPPTALWLLVLATASGCADRELAHEAAVLSLTDRLEVGALDVPTPLPLSGVLEEVVWVREGLAGVVVELDAADGIGGAADGMVLTRWHLPLLSAPAPHGGGGQPELMGLPIPLFVPQMEPEGPTAIGFWVHDSELAIVHPNGQDLPERIRLRYVVYAAQLAGTALGAGFTRTDLLGLQIDRGSSSVEAIAIPSGATLSISLPPVPAGRLEGAFSAVSSDERGLGPEVSLRIDGAEVFRNVVGTDAQPTAIGSAGRRFVALADSFETRTIEIEVLDAPGSVVFFERPIWSRARSWRDDSNVLLIVVDSLRADRIGVYGSRDELTPNLDRFTRDTLWFKEAWSTSSWTLPSMASILTSTHGVQNQAWFEDRRLGRGVTTIAEAFAAEGYRTVAFTDGGFVAPAFGLDRGFHTFDGEGGGLQALTERFQGFLDSNEGGPWFVLLHTYELHAPYDPPEEARAAVERRHPEALKERAPDPREFYAEADRGSLSPAVVKTLRELYDEEVRHTDGLLAELLEDLRERGLYDDAIICITSDHGEEFGEHGLLGHGDTLYVEQLHVPLFLKLSENQRGSVVIPEPVSLVDLAPTLVQAAGLDARLGLTTFAGTSLVGGKRWQRRPHDPLSPTYIGSPVYASRNHPDAGLLEAFRVENEVIIQGQYIYSNKRESSGREFYHLGRDPWQMRDAKGKDNRKSIAQLRKNLERFQERFGEVMVEDTEAALNAAQALALEERRL